MRTSAQVCFYPESRVEVEQAAGVSGSISLDFSSSVWTPLGTVSPMLQPECFLTHSPIGAT